VNGGGPRNDELVDGVKETGFETDVGGGSCEDKNRSRSQIGLGIDCEIAICQARFGNAADRQRPGVILVELGMG
jgi:hypothetical protein